ERPSGRTRPSSSRPSAAFSRSHGSSSHRFGNSQRFRLPRKSELSNPLASAFNRAPILPFSSAGLPRKLQDHREPRGRRQSHEQRGPAERRASPRRSRPKGPPSRGGSSIPTRRGRA